MNEQTHRAPNASHLPNANWQSTVRTGMFLLLFGFGGFLAWACWVPIDEGVPMQGVLSLDSKRKRIEHLAGGIVERIAVKEGQHVQEGDELVILNEVQTRSSLNATLGQWRRAVATVARLKAEGQGRHSIAFPIELTEGKPDAETLSIMKAQQDLLASRKTSLDGELSILKESANGLERQLASLNDLKAGRDKQVQLFESQLASYQKLSKQGFVSPNQVMDLERQLSELQSKQSEVLANIGSIRAKLAEFRMRENQRLMDARRETETLLADAQKEASTLAERLTALKDAHQRLVLRAPVSGTVVDVAVHTVGGVAKPGDRLMEIVPDHDDLVVEAKLPPHLVDRVHAGLSADVHFDAYVTLMRRPVVSGRVVMVSADSRTDARSDAAYYALNVSIPRQSLQSLTGVKLQPGMQATVMVKTGERSLMTYLFRPLTKRFEGALSEV